MSIEAKGRPWDRATHERIKRKGGEHFRSPCQDYIDLERKIEAHELRYADRVDVYVAGQKYADTVVVLNGGVYMSTGIENDEDVTDVNPNRPVEQPVDYELQRLATHYQRKANSHRREARLWAAIAAACLLLVVAVMLIPSEWIYLAFEAFR